MLCVNGITLSRLLLCLQLLTQPSPLSMAAWKNFSFPLVCRGLKISPSAELIYSGKLKQGCRACLGTGFPSVALPSREKRTAQRSPRQLGFQIRETAPMQCCTQANKPPGRARLTLVVQAGSFAPWILQTALAEVLLCFC